MQHIDEDPVLRQPVAVVVPDHLIKHIAGAIAKLVETEKIVLNAAREHDFDFNKFSQAWTAFEKART